MTAHPPADVLAAFGLRGPAAPLTGGKGGTWRAGDVVLKPAEGEPETLWRGTRPHRAPTSRRCWRPAAR